MEQPAFARVLEVKIPKGPVYAQSHLSIQLVSEAFGPPEVRDGADFWNFADTSGKMKYAIVAKNVSGRGAMEMNFVAPVNQGAEFFEWAMEKINLTENGDIAPAFLGTQRMALRAERL